MTHEPSDKGFASRWSARKLAARSGLEAEATGNPSPDADAAVAGDALETSEQTVGECDIEPPLTDADMPPVESLNADSDLSNFFSEGVSATLRKAALRRVFALPSYNVRDGLNDYDEDYSVFEPLGDTVTCDMKFHTARRERAREEAEARAAEGGPQRAHANEQEQLAEGEHERESTEHESTEREHELSEHEPTDEHEPGEYEPDVAPRHAMNDENLIATETGTLV